MRRKQAIMTLEKPASAYMFIHYIYFSSLLLKVILQSEEFLAIASS